MVELAYIGEMAGAVHQADGTWRLEKAWCTSDAEHPAGGHGLGAEGEAAVTGTLALQCPTSQGNGPISSKMAQIVAGESHNHLCNINFSA